MSANAEFVMLLFMCVFRVRRYMVRKKSESAEVESNGLHSCLALKRLIDVA